MKKISLSLVFLILILGYTGAQSPREIAARDRILVQWARDGVVPITAPSPDGTQNLAVLASNWYFPLAYTAKAGTRSVLRLYTNRTFDCSRAFMIPSLNIRRTLPATGVVEIPIPPQKKGDVLFGTCSMGMYTFTIKFE